MGDDEHYTNAYYGRVLGLTTRELNRLEAHFLGCLDGQPMLALRNSRSTFPPLSFLLLEEAGVQTSLLFEPYSTVSYNGFLDALRMKALRDTPMLSGRRFAFKIGSFISKDRRFSVQLL